MNDKEITSFIDPLSGESFFRYTHPSGAVAVCVKKKTSLPSAAVSLPIGGGSSGVTLEGFDEIPIFPGAAHFAEHMIFTGRGGQLDRFCALGADANAETSMDFTTYYLTASEKFLYAFGELVGMVADPRFDRSELEKEREIILREKAEDDEIFGRARNALADLIYKRGSVRRDIIGDRKSIKKMSSPLLKGIYSCAYRPSVMGIAAVTDEDPNRVFSMIDAALLGQISSDRPAFGRIKSKRRQTGERRARIRGENGVDMIFCGIPFSLEGSGLSYEKRRVYSSMLEAMLFDRTEYIGRSFRERGEQIYGSMRSDSSIFFDDMLIYAGVACEDVDRACDIWNDVFESARRMGAERIFPNAEAKRRSLVADYLSVFDSPSELSLTLSEYIAAGASFVRVGRELSDFDEKEFFDFADKFLASAEVYFVTT